jgi:hypothetical protein
VVTSAGILLSSICGLVLFGILGVGRGEGVFANDMQHLFIAGELWERNLSPYNSAVFTELMGSKVNVVYPYPPNSSPLALALSFGSLAYAKVLIAALNLVALGCIVYFIIKAGVESTRNEGIRLNADARVAYAFIAIAILIGSPFTSHVIWMGQTTLLAAAPILLCWLIAERRRDLLAGFFLGLGALKPQLTSLCGLWFFLDRRWLMLSAAAVTVAAMSVWPIVSTGFGSTWPGWISAVGEYQRVAFNLVEFRHVFGIRSLLVAVGLQVPSLSLLALLAVVVLYVYRAHYEVIWLPGVIFSISALLLYSHDYDLASVSVMGLPLLLASRGNWPVRVAILLLLAVLFFPQRVWESAGIGMVSRSRELALVGILAIYMVLCSRTQQRLRASDWQLT